MTSEQFAEWHERLKQGDAAAKAERAKSIPSKLALSSAEFVAGFTPPDYLIAGLLQRRFLYSLTSPTGGGKTAIAILLAHWSIAE